MYKHFEFEVQTQKNESFVNLKFVLNYFKALQKCLKFVKNCSNLSNFIIQTN